MSELNAKQQQIIDKFLEETDALYAERERSRGTNAKGKYLDGGAPKGFILLQRKLYKDLQDAAEDEE